MAFSSVAGLLEAARDKPLWRAVLEDDLRDRGADGDRSWHQMSALWTAMKAPVAEYDPAARSHSGLTGGAGALLDGPGPGLCPPFLRQVIAAALKTGECNACMRRIVAAPTAGASGVLPAVLVFKQEQLGFSDRDMLHALAAAGIVGNIIKTNASISGAECGCQAEVGSACSMAAAGLAELYHMDLDQIEYAAEVAMEHHLGLTCDPIGGLVQIPCIERNAVAAMRAINALSLANFLTYTRKISFDMVVKTMYETGRDLFSKYRETSEGGLAKMYRE